MRRLLLVALLACVAASPARAQEAAGAAPAAEASADFTSALTSTSPSMSAHPERSAAAGGAESKGTATPTEAEARAAAVDADAKAAAAAGLALPDSTRRAGEDAQAALAAERRPRGALSMIGIALGAGFPDLATASLLVRPVPSVRLFGGPSWGYVGWGLQGGVVFVPWTWYVSPTLSLEAGKLFRADLSRFLDGGGDGKSAVRPLLKGVDYQYAAADLGLELGSPRGLAFTMRLGLSWVTVRANGSATADADDGTRVTLKDPTVRATLPSFKLGLQYWF